MSHILSIAPYKFLPPTNGGHWGIVVVEKTLSVFNNVDTITTDNNKPSAKNYPFHVHPVLSSGKLRYLPFSQYRKVIKLAGEIKPDYIFCHHHYMFPMAYKVAKNAGKPLYIRCHNIESERFRATGKWWWRAMKFFEKKAFQKSDKIFFVTEDDKEWAVKNYSLSATQTAVMPFATEFEKRPALTLSQTKTDVATQFGLNANVPWLFFMGQLDYAPNSDAVRYIVENILPQLKKHLPHFHILICGKNLSGDLQQAIKNSSVQNEITYLGFVPDIEPIIAACDAMLNPVVSGGGVKTKVVESLAWNKTVVSSFNGAIGIEPSVCGKKLLVAPNFDWATFVTLVTEALQHKEDNIPAQFFDYYYTENIAKRMQQYFV